MKRIGHLTELTASPENIYGAWKDSMKRKPKNRLRRSQVKAFNADLPASLSEVQNIIQTGEWNMTPDDYGFFTRPQCGKIRDICWNKSYLNNVVMHAIIRTDGKVLEDTLIADTFSGIKGRGPVAGMERMKEYIHEYPDDMPIYVLKIDIFHYYDNIQKHKLISMIGCKIKDKTSLSLHSTAIFSCPRPGVPKGNLTSQPYSNFYLSPLDHYVKERLGFRHYARYCDDIVVLSSDKYALVELLEKIKVFLADYGLTIKPNAQVFPIERNGIDFMGYVFHRHEVRLRKRIERSLRRAARLFKADPSEKHYKTLAAYWGWVKHITRPMALWNAVVGKPLKELRPAKEAAA